MTSTSLGIDLPQNAVLKDSIKEGTALPNEIVEKITAYVKEDPICGICKNVVTIPVKLKCKHLFDVDCLYRWIIRGSAVHHGNYTCPLCRSAGTLNREDNSDFTKDFPEPSEMTQLTIITGYPWNHLTLGYVYASLNTEAGRIKKIIYRCLRKTDTQSITVLDALKTTKDSHIFCAYGFPYFSRSSPSDFYNLKDLAYEENFTTLNEHGFRGKSGVISFIDDDRFGVRYISQDEATDGDEVDDEWECAHQLDFLIVAEAHSRMMAEYRRQHPTNS